MVKIRQKSWEKMGESKEIIGIPWGKHGKRSDIRADEFAGNSIEPNGGPSSLSQV